MTEDTVNAHAIADVFPDKPWGMSWQMRIKSLLLSTAIIIYTLLFPIVFRRLQQGENTGNLWLCMLGWFVPPLILAFFMAPRSRGQRYKRGEKLLGKGRPVEAAKEFVNAASWRHIGAEEKLGDMHLAGGGLEEDADKAVAWYAKALQNFEQDVDMEAFRTPPPEGRTVLTKMVDSLPIEPEKWLGRFAEKLVGLTQAGNVAAQSLLAEVRWQQGRYADAFETARSLPDDLGLRLDCFSRLLQKRTRISRLDKDDLVLGELDGVEADYPGVPMKGFWAKHDTRVAAYGFLLAASALVVCLVGHLGGIADRWIAVFLLLLCFPAYMLWRYWKYDPYKAGQRHFLARRYGRAAWEFTRAYDSLHPGAAERLGKMRFDGIGVEKDFDKAFTAYAKAGMHLLVTWIREYETTRDGASLFSATPFSGLDDNPDAFAVWKREVVAGLERLGEAGKAKAYVLLADMTESEAEKIRYAAMAFAAEPSPENEVQLATNVLAWQDADEAEVRASLGRLERLFAKGEYEAGYRLVVVHLRGTSHLAADAKQALVLFRRLLGKTRLSAGYERLQKFSQAYLALEIMETLGCDVLTDEECLVAAGVRASPA